MADELLNEVPKTITSYHAARSKGGKNDYYSEGRYWWPDSLNMDGPFIRKDGLAYPGRFIKHREAVSELGKTISTLTIAAVYSKEKKYTKAILEHIDAWFVKEESRMNSSLLYAQAIKGIVDGRGIGMIDLIVFINIANSIRLLEEKQLIASNELLPVKKWFSDFATWASTHPYGIDEKTNNNNHSTWWGTQVTSYALLAGNNKILEEGIEQFKTQLEIQMNEIGAFPSELERTRPSHYTNYNLFAWTAYALLLAENSFEVWEYQSSNGSIVKAIDYSYNYFVNPSAWNHSTKLEDGFTTSSNDFLYLAYLGLDDRKYFKQWAKSSTNEGPRQAHLLIWKMLTENE
jgi:hypothetical protein